MPFVKKNEAQSSQSRPTTRDTRNIFVGRQNELHFLTENILKPEDPGYNIISIDGNGGVGKSTLLARFIEECRGAEYKNYCLTAIVDERQATAANMMERFSEQLHIQGDFRKALARYKEALRRQQDEEDTLQDEVLQRVPDFAGAIVEGVPIVGPVLRESLKATTAHFVSGYRHEQARREIKHLEDPIGDLTRAFVTELNHLAETRMAPGLHGTRRRHRIILFFDTFEQLASEIALWLLDYFLPLEISNSIVLVIAGRIPIERSLPDDPKRWLQFKQNGDIYSFSLHSFTEEETRSYLEQRGITDPAHISRIWQLSRGLPLYLGLLTLHPHYEVDPTADVVANFLRWIPESEAVKRRFVLDAALFTRPFNQDDLAAFSYIPEQERPALYHWLINQPFTRRIAQGGRYSYHELAEDLFSRHLYQESPNTCAATRRALADHYRHQLEALQAQGEDTYSTPDWFSLTLALAQQLLLLPDSASHIAAIEHFLNANEHTDQNEEIIRVLRDYSQEQPYTMYYQANADARRTARVLLHYIETELTDPQFLPAVNELLNKVAAIPSFSPILLARLYEDRGVAHGKLDDDAQAITDLSRAIELDPRNAGIYGNRGITYRSLKRYEQALSDFNAALALDDGLAWVYVGRGEVYRHHAQYQLAIADFNRAILLDPHDPDAYEGLARVHRIIGDYDAALKDVEQAFALDLEPSEQVSLYFQLGEIYRNLHEYERAIEEFTHGVAIDQSSAWVYGSRGKSYASLGQYEQALADFNRAIAISPRYFWGYGQRGKIYRHLRQYERALADLDAAIQLAPANSWAYDERGLVRASLQDYQQALADFNQALAGKPSAGKIYAHRASIYLAFRDIERAREDYAMSSDLDPNHLLASWMCEWLTMCQNRPTLSNAERLERIAAIRPRDYVARVCRAVACWLRGDTTQGLIEIASAAQNRPLMWDAPFWQGMILNTNERPDALDAINRALEHGMPPILLTPLRWFAEDRPAFYEQYLRPLLLRYGL